jgi:hypothetical protein
MPGSTSAGLDSKEVDPQGVDMTLCGGFFPADKGEEK